MTPATAAVDDDSRWYGIWCAGLDGFDVAEVLARYHPRLPVLCMSGYVSEATRESPFEGAVHSEAVHG